MIIILQQAFNKYLREISLQAQYILLMDTPRDRSIVRSLAKQLVPGCTSFLTDAFLKAVTGKEYGSIFLDLHPKNKRFAAWVRSELLPSESCRFYTPK